MKEIKLLYRAYFDFNEWGGSDIKIYKYSVLRHTQCGVWISVDRKDKWVSLSGCKRYAYPTKEEAYKSFKKRKERQIVILTHQLSYAKRQLKLVNKITK